MIASIIGGLVIGFIYALIALGFYITWICHRSVSFAQGDLLMIAAFIGYQLYAVMHLPFLVVLIIVIVFIGFLGSVIEFVAVRPAARVLTMGWLMSTMGIAMILRNIALRIWQGLPVPFPSPVGDKLIRLGTVSLRPQELLIFGVAIVVMLCFFFFLKRTMFGKALEAVAFNRDTASLMGINPAFMINVAYIIATILAGIGGLMVAPITFVSHTMGLNLLLASFIGALLGCLENPVGIVIGSLLIGLVTSTVTMWNTTIGPVSGLILLIIVLAIKPVGLLGKSQS